MTVKSTTLNPLRQSYLESLLSELRSREREMRCEVECLIKSVPQIQMPDKVNTDQLDEFELNLRELMAPPGYRVIVSRPDALHVRMGFDGLRALWKVLDAARPGRVALGTPAEWGQDKVDLLELAPVEFKASVPEVPPEAEARVCAAFEDALEAAKRNECRARDEACVDCPDPQR